MGAGDFLADNIKDIKGKRIIRENRAPQIPSSHLCVGMQEMDKILNEYFSSVSTMEKDM